MTQLLVPFSFLGIDAAIYLVSAIIGFAVAYYAFRLHSFSENRSHYYLYMGFTAISIGLLLLSVATFYAFINLKVLCTQECYANMLDPAFDIWDFGYWLYYLASIIAYGFFALMYMPKRKERKLFFILPVWFVAFPYFHLLSFFMVSYVVFRSFISYRTNKSLKSMLVFAAFLAIGIFHLLSLLNIFGKAVYVIAHIILLLGFLSLLAVLLKINKSQRVVKKR